MKVLKPKNEKKNIYVIQKNLDLKLVKTQQYIKLMQASQTTNNSKQIKPSNINPLSLQTLYNKAIK